MAVASRRQLAVLGNNVGTLVLRLISLLAVAVRTWWRHQRGKAVDEARRRLCHAPGIAGGARTPAFAGEDHQEVMPAVATAGAGKAVGKDGAFQAFGKRNARQIGKTVLGYSKRSVAIRAQTPCCRP